MALDAEKDDLGPLKVIHQTVSTLPPTSAPDATNGLLLYDLARPHGPTRRGRGGGAPTPLGAGQLAPNGASWLSGTKKRMAS